MAPVRKKILQRDLTMFGRTLRLPASASVTSFGETPAPPREPREPLNPAPTHTATPPAGFTPVSRGEVSSDIRRIASLPLLHPVSTGLHHRCRRSGGDRP